MMSGTSGMRIDRDFEVCWVGWRSTLFDLQQRGWDVSIDVQPWRNTHHFRLRHEVLELIAIAEDYHMDLSQDRMPPIHVNWVASMKSLNVMAPQGFQACKHIDIDASPGAMLDSNQWDGRLESLFGIRQQDKVFIEQADLSVLDHLKAIKDKQADQQAEIRNRLLSESSRNNLKLNSLKLISVA